MPLLWSHVDSKEGDERGITLTVKEQYVLMLYASSLQNNPKIYFPDWNETNLNDIIEFTEDLLSHVMLDETPPPVNTMQSRWNLFAGDIIRGVNDAGSTPSSFNDALQRFAYVTQQSPAAINDQMHYTIYMDTGNYTIRHLYQKSSQSGKLSVYVWKQFGDGAILTPINQLDMYNASTLRNQIATADFTIDERGEYRIVLGVPSKNASSSGYTHYQTMTLIYKNEGGVDP